MKFLLRLIVVLMMVGSAYAQLTVSDYIDPGTLIAKGTSGPSSVEAQQSNLPACDLDRSAYYWNNCFGTNNSAFRLYVGE